jgi:hypothetical protein
MRAVKWAVTNGLFLAVVYFGIVEGVQGARNVAVFFAWFAFAISLLGLSKEVRSDAFKRGPSVPLGVSAAVDFVALGIFLWHGWFVTGSAWLIHALLMYSAYEQAAKEAAT